MIILFLLKLVFTGNPIRRQVHDYNLFIITATTPILIRER